MGAVLQVQAMAVGVPLGAMTFAWKPWFRYILSRDFVRPAKP
ncbi:hypothetical protein [Streptomyces sp. NPDC058755]